jgi:hypothetical protein
MSDIVNIGGNGIHVPYYVTWAHRKIEIANNQ